jgi:hypothetical protein
VPAICARSDLPLSHLHRYNDLFALEEKI